MTKWVIHNKWARKLGIRLTDEDLNRINQIIDDIDDYEKHDWGRHRKWEKQIQERMIYEEYGYEGILAADLHHILDILETFLNPQKEKQMELFDKAAKSSRGVSGLVRRIDGEPIRNGRVIPASARIIQGALGKCYICKQPLANKPFFELPSPNGRNILIHKECLYHFPKQKAPEPLEFNTILNINQEQIKLDIKQVKDNVIRKALEVGIREEVIKFVLENFWEIIDDIERCPH
jgi:hypothetical protein